MATTYVYLNSEDLVKLFSGEKVEIQMTAGLRNSNRLFLLVDQEKKNSYEESPSFQQSLRMADKILKEE